MTTIYQASWNYTLSFSDTNAQLSLAANVAQTYTVPGSSSQKYVAIFEYSSNSNVYVGLNVTAASPAPGTNTTTAYLAYKPQQRFVKGGDVISLISPDAAGAYMGVSLYTIPG